ncbi:hypothetical protein ACFL1O_00215 [Patescibacteria group bacterium]
MKRYFLILVAIIFLAMTTGCFTIAGTLLGAGLGGKSGAAIGAGAGVLADIAWYEYKQSRNSPATGTSQPVHSVFQPRSMNSGEQAAYIRGRAEAERRLQRERERRAYQRGKRGVYY